MVAPDEFKNYNWRKRSDCRVDFFEMQSGDRPLVRVGSRSYVADEFDPFEIEEILGEVCSSFVSKVLNGLTPNQFVNRRSPKGELKVQNSCKQRRELLDAKVSSRDGILVLLVSENCSAASKALNRALTGHSIDGMVFRSAKNAHPVAFFDGEEISMELHELQDDRMRDLVERIDRGS
ncbi:MAG TPA: hypothetical protein DDZ68_01900 [Parvularcula sp.]|nr:hypothetical protein [Parvularcula sp.]HBS30498.1 hypothetical protein [Parvularcula sp.]HBS33560.1 hypothetical protein [Parvularcula sp.]